MNLFTKVAVLLALLGIALKVALEGDPTLKLRVAIKMFGWSGLMNIVKESFAERMVGHKSTKSREAWHELLETLAEVELKYLSPARGFTTEEDIAEGHRYLSHVLKAAFEFQMEKEEMYPHFADFPTPTRKLMGDNPDALYLLAAIDADHVYKVTGSLTGEVYLSFTLAESACYGCFSNAVVGDMNHFDLQMQDDGKSFELYVSKERPEGAVNWLKIDSGGGDQLHVITRHYFEQVLNTQMDHLIAPNVSIELVGEAPPLGKTQYRDDAWMAERLRRVGRFVREHTMDMNNDPKTVPSWFSFDQNVIGPPSLFRNHKTDKNAGGGLGAVDIVYAAGPFKLKEGESLKVVAKIPKDCKFVSVNLWNRFLQTLDYAERQVSLNRKQMRIEPDGIVNIILSAEKPSDPEVNWLDSEGREQGTLFWRFLLCTEQVEKINTTLIKAGS